MISKVFLIIANIVDILSQKNLYFKNLKDLIDGFITKVKLDFYDEVRSAELNKVIREYLSEYIELSIKKNVSLLFNFFTKDKGLDKSTFVCKLQAIYDETLGARRMYKLRLYVDPKTAYNNNAYTITSTYHNDTEDLIIYATYANQFNNS